MAMHPGEIVKLGYIGLAKIIVFDYVNYNGVKSTRRALPLGLEYGTTPYHKEPQMLLRCYDLDKYGDRTFACKDMTNVHYAIPEHFVPAKAKPDHD